MQQSLLNIHRCALSPSPALRRCGSRCHARAHSQACPLLCTLQWCVCELRCLPPRVCQDLHVPMSPPGSRMEIACSRGSLQLAPHSGSPCAGRPGSPRFPWAAATAALPPYSAFWRCPGAGGAGTCAGVGGPSSPAASRGTRRRALRRAVSVCSRLRPHCSRARDAGQLRMHPAMLHNPHACSLARLRVAPDHLPWRVSRCPRHVGTWKASSSATGAQRK